MRVDPERCEHALLGRGDRERGVARGDPRADRDDARDADRPRPLDEERGGLVAAVEMGVGVDHRRRLRRGQLEAREERRRGLDARASRR